MVGRSLRIVAVAVTLLFSQASCGGSAKPAATGGVKVCKKAGQRCVHSAGKVGLCMGTKTGGLACASQH